MAKTELEKVKDKATKLGIVFKEEDTLESISELIEKSKSKKPKVILKDVNGDDVDEKDYFFPGKDKEGNTIYAPEYFQKYNGLPVTREDMLTVFNKVFNPKDGFLFYKDMNSELYLVIVPIKHATTVGQDQNSIGCDFQKHAISFLNDGSVNLDTLRTKLERIKKSGTLKFEDR